MDGNLDNASASILDDLRPLIIRRIRAWLRLTGYAPASQAELVFDSCLSTLWIRLHEANTGGLAFNWQKSLRHALYLEFERGQSHRVGFDKIPEVDTADICSDLSTSLPLQWLDWVSEMEAENGHPARVATARGWSRRQMRVHLSGLLRALGGPEYFDDLRRRVARLLLRIADGNEIDNSSIKEQRRVFKLLGWLELPHDLSEARELIRTLVDTKSPSDPGNRIVSSANREPRAKA
jgi:hypothetical protein